MTKSNYLNNFTSQFISFNAFFNSLFGFLQLKKLLLAPPNSQLSYNQYPGGKAQNHAASNHRIRPTPAVTKVYIYIYVRYIFCKILLVSIFLSHLHTLHAALPHTFTRLSLRELIFFNDSSVSGALHMADSQRTLSCFPPTTSMQNSQELF